MIVTCMKELGRWTIRINGHFVADFWRESLARRIAMRMNDAIVQANREQSAQRTEG